MGKAMFPSDTITFKVSTGDNSAGNGGDGYNEGDITSKPSIEFEPSNKAEGADVHVKNGDNVSQKAYWDAGGANAKAEKYCQVERHGLPDKKSDAKAESTKAEGGTAKSNGDQESDSGHNKSDVDANTKAYQENWLDADQGQKVYAGIGGEGGDHNKAEGGDVHIKASIETANLNDVLNIPNKFDIDDFAHGLSDAFEALINLPRSLCQAGLFFGWFISTGRGPARKPAAQDAARLQPADRRVDAIGAQIIEPARHQVVAHRLLCRVEPATAAALQFQKHHLPARSGEHQIGRSSRHAEPFQSCRGDGIAQLAERHVREPPDRADGAPDQVDQGGLAGEFQRRRRQRSALAFALNRCNCRAVTCAAITDHPRTCRPALGTRRAARAHTARAPAAN